MGKLFLREKMNKNPSAPSKRKPNYGNNQII